MELTIQALISFFLITVTFYLACTNASDIHATNVLQIDPKMCVAVMGVVKVSSKFSVLHFSSIVNFKTKLFGWIS